MEKTLYIVVPCYNEEAVLPETAKRLSEKHRQLVEEKMISEKSRIVFVNDGSKDRTWEIIRQLHDENPVFSGINLAHNKGHQNAVLAGLMTVRELCNAAITIDADLQDDVDAIDEMVKKFNEGNDVVYGVRSSRKTDTFFKRFTAEGFYKLMSAMGVELVFNHADFRLMSKRVLDALSEYKEVNLFLRGIIPQIGFKSDSVYYERHERFSGESKYSPKKMLELAVDGITSFSVKPLSIIAVLGAVLFVLSVIAFIVLAVSSIFADVNLALAGIICSVWAVGGLQILCTGVVGGYIGKIYAQTKGRPRFVVEQFLNGKDGTDTDSSAD